MGVPGISFVIDTARLADLWLVEFAYLKSKGSFEEPQMQRAVHDTWIGQSGVCTGLEPDDATNAGVRTLLGSYRCGCCGVLGAACAIFRHEVREGLP